MPTVRHGSYQFLTPSIIIVKHCSFFLLGLRRPQPFLPSQRRVRFWRSAENVRNQCGDGLQDTCRASFGRNGISFSGFRYDFNAAGQIANLPTQLGGTGGRFGFGILNTLRDNSQRILQIGAKLYF